MAGGLQVALIAWDVVQEVRGTVAMMMFIMEEAIQAAMMAQYLATKYELLDKVEEINKFVEEDLVTPLLELSRHKVAMAAYPLQYAYEAFALATKTSLDFYKVLLEEIKRRKEEEERQR